MCKAVRYGALRCAALHCGALVCGTVCCGVVRCGTDYGAAGSVLYVVVRVWYSVFEWYGAVCCGTVEGSRSGAGQG